MCCGLQFVIFHTNNATERERGIHSTTLSNAMVTQRRWQKNKIPGWSIDKITLKVGKRSTRRKPCPSGTVITINHTCTELGSNPHLRINFETRPSEIRKKVKAKVTLKQVTAAQTGS
jgi:hypothetical protein